MADNFFNIPGFNALPYNPQLPGLAQTRQAPNVQGPQFINPYEKQNEGMSPYTMQPSWQFGLNYNQIAFSSAVQGIGAFLRGNNQKKDFASYNKVQQNPLSQLPENPNTTDQSLYGMKQYAEGGRFDDFDDFDEDDFEDLKGELDKYFSGDKEKLQEGTKEEETPEETQPQEEQLEKTQPFHGAMDFLNQPQEEEQDNTQINQSDADIMAQLSGEKPIPKPEQPHPSVYAGKPDNKVEAFKRGIAQVENAGYQEGNKNSTAFGRYQFTAPTREGVRQQFFKDIPKGDFETAYKSDPKFQERVMDVYGSHLLQKYSDPHQAATAFFLGEGKANMYNQPDYNPGHGNVSVGKYLNTFDKGYNKRQGGHIMNSPGSVTTGFDRPYNFKMEDGGDPNQIKKPIQTNNPNDPRLQRYNDSLTMYNRTQEAIKKMGAVNNPNEWNNYQTNVVAKDNQQGEAYTRLRDAGIGNSIGHQTRTFPSVNNSQTEIGVYEYAKPQQPVVYNRSNQPPGKKPIITNNSNDPKRSQIQGPQQMATGKPNIGAPIGGPSPLAGGPTNFSFTGRDDQGQQTTRYFPNLDNWQNAIDQMGYRWSNITNNGKEAHASGYQFKEGGEYELTNDQIKQLKKQGYTIEIIK